MKYAAITPRAITERDYHPWPSDAWTERTETVLCVQEFPSMQALSDYMSGHPEARAIEYREFTREVTLI